MTLLGWGWENGFSIHPKFDPDISDKNPFEVFPIRDVNTFSLSISTLNRNSLYSGDYTEDYSVLTKERIKEYLDILITKEVNDTEALMDFILFSYSRRNNQSQIDHLVKLYQEVLEEEGLKVYDDFQKISITSDQDLPKELVALKDIDLDDPSMPVIWTRERTLSRPITYFVDLEKPVKAVYYLPPSEATKIFGDKGTNGFYALMGYEQPLSHPEKQRELLEFELDNFFTTLSNDVNEKAWIEKLKKIHKKMQDRYPKGGGEWITLFTTRAHKYNINLVIKNQEIVAAYRNGVERIDEIVNDEDIKFLLEYTNKTHDDSDLTLIQNFYKQGNRQTPLVVIGDQKADMSQLLALGIGEIKSISIMTAVVGIKHHGEEGKHGVIEINSTARPPFNNMQEREHAIITPSIDGVERIDVDQTQLSSTSNQIDLGIDDVIIEGVQVYVKDKLLELDKDYKINQKNGRLTIVNQSYLDSGIPITVRFDRSILNLAPPFTSATKDIDLPFDEIIEVGDGNPTSFINEKDKLHYIIIPIYGGNAKIVREVKTLVNQYNAESFSELDIKSTSLNLNKETKVHLVLLRRFSDADKAMDYYNQFKRDADKVLDPAKYSFDMYPVNQHNYREIITTKSASSYGEFFKQNYLEDK